MAEKTGKAFDLQIFSRLMGYAKRYKLKFFIAASSTILLSIVALLNPYILSQAVDSYIIEKDTEGLVFSVLLMFGVLMLEVLLRFTFIYFANWVGQHIIRDIRAKIFRHILQFKMSYFDNNSVGKLVTRVVSDIETIAAFFSNGVFTIVSDILQMFAVAVLMFVLNWKLALIALAVSHTVQCPYCIDAYTEDAMEKGCDSEEMMEAVHVAAAIKSGAALVHSVQMMNKYKDLSM